MTPGQFEDAVNKSVTSAITFIEQTINVRKALRSIEEDSEFEKCFQIISDMRKVCLGFIPQITELIAKAQISGFTIISADLFKKLSEEFTKTVKSGESPINSSEFDHQKYGGTLNFEIVGNLKGIERLDILDWDEIHEVVQSILEKLDEVVRQFRPQASISPGRNSSRDCSLFSYRTYECAEPLVVGISFARGNNGIIVHGDITEETTGYVLFDVPPTEVVGRAEIVNAARQVANQLVQYGKSIASKASGVNP